MAKSDPTPGIFRRLLIWLGMAAAPKPAPKKRRLTDTAARSMRKRGFRTNGMEPWSPPDAVRSLDAIDLRLMVRDDLLEEHRRLEGLDGERIAADRAFLARLARTLSSESLELPIFPKVSLELDRLLRDGDPQNREVVELLSREPDLLRRVWQRANCALYRVPVTDLDKAIARIGYDEVWRIGMSVCLQGSVFRAGTFQPRVEEMRSAGMVAGTMAAWLEGTARGEAYMAGLLHQAGGMYILRHAAMGRRQRPSDACLNVVLKRHQAALSVLMVRTWGLGDRVAAGVGLYAAPKQAPDADRAFTECLRDGVLAAHLGRQASRGGGRMADRVLLESYLGKDRDVEKVIRRAQRAWTAERGEVALESEVAPALRKAS